MKNEETERIAQLTKWKEAIEALSAEQILKQIHDRDDLGHNPTLGAISEMVEESTGEPLHGALHEWAYSHDFSGVDLSPEGQVLAVRDGLVHHIEETLREAVEDDGQT